MPIYEFECDQCHQEFEELVLRASDAEKMTCPTCHSERVHKKISLFGARVGGGSASAAATTCTTST